MVGGPVRDVEWSGGGRGMMRLHHLGTRGQQEAMFLKQLTAFSPSIHGVHSQVYGKLGEDVSGLYSNILIFRMEKSISYESVSFTRINQLLNQQIIEYSLPQVLTPQSLHRHWRCNRGRKNCACLPGACSPEEHMDSETWL